jgi:hypothetical protein
MISNKAREDILGGTIQLARLTKKLHKICGGKGVSIEIDVWKHHKTLDIKTNSEDTFSGTRIYPCLYIEDTCTMRFDSLNELFTYVEKKFILFRKFDQ